jgi:hypothetical protein
VLTHRHDNRADLLVGLRGFETETFARAIAVPFQGEMLRVIGREDFISMTVFADGRQHTAEARNALASTPGAVNLSLVRRLGHATRAMPRRRSRRCSRSTEPAGRPAPALGRYGSCGSGSEPSGTPSNSTVDR